MAAGEAKPWLHELTAADLYAHCRIADERRALDLTASYSAWLPYRVLPPREASNEDLDALKPLYVELLQDPARIFDILDGPSTANDGRAVLLHALEYALLTRGARCEVGGLGAENFPLHLPCKRIATNGRLLRWCRDALRAPQDRRAALIIKSCVGLLRMVGDLLKNPRAAVEDFLGAGGHEALWDDVVACLRHFDARTGRPDAFPPQAMAELMLFALDLGHHLDLPSEALMTFVPARHRDFFAEALERARPQLDAHTYNALHDILVAPSEGFLGRAARFQQEASEFRARNKATRRRICDGPNCSNKAPFKCNRCGLVSYCSRECQTRHWKHGHKQLCRPTAGDGAAAAAATAKARTGPSPLLAKQDKLLRENGGDYMLDVDAEKYMAIDFANPMGAVFFKMLRLKAAGGCRRSLWMMWEQLCGVVQEPAMRRQLRKQLRGEYGVDPEACKNAPVTGSVSAEDVQAVMGGVDEAPIFDQLSRESETDPQVRGALAAAGARMPPPRYSAETEAFARSKGCPDTEEGSAAFILERVMTSRLELLGWACRDREDSDTYDLERWTANCGGDAAMARRVVAEARARVQRHVLEGTRPDDSDDTDEEARRPAPAKPSGGRKKGKKGRRKK